MKFTLNRSTALQVLRQALRTCNTKAKGEADSEFLFKPDDGYMFVTSLNGNAEQNIFLECADLEADHDEAFSVSGAALVEFLNQFPDEEVKCIYTSEDGQLVIGNKKTRVAFPTGLAENFVPFNYVAQGKSIEVSAEQLRDALKATAFAASRDYTMAPYTAVNLKISGTDLIATACDTLRISRYAATIDDIGADQIEVLLPHDIAETLSAMFDDVAKVNISPGQRHVRIEWGDTTFTSSLENGIGKPYPDLSRFLQGKVHGRVKISKGDLLRSMKLAAIVAKDSCVNLAIKPLDSNGAGGGLVLSTNEQDRGMSKDVLVVEKQEGEAAVFVAHKHLIKAIESVPSPWIDLSFRHLKDDNVALVLADGGFEHLIFPVNPQQPDDGTDNGNEETND